MNSYDGPESRPAGDFWADKIHYASAQPRRPSAFSPWQRRFATTISRRPYVASTRCRSLGPGTPPPSHPQGTRDPRTRGQKGPREPKGPKGGKGTQGRLRRPLGNGPMGPFGAIPKQFRMGGYFDEQAISNGRRNVYQIWSTEFEVHSSRVNFIH